jgi:NAD(P)-dependent dehydrogenase (short-subunit alcohol dehydrogenase family)
VGTGSASERPVCWCWRVRSCLQRGTLTASTVDQIVDTAEVAKGSFLIIVQTVIEKTGRVDVLVNSIGNGTIGAVEEISEPEARIVVKDVFWSAARMIQAVLPTMRAQGGGRIVSKSSLGGLMGLRSAPSKVP